RLGRLAAVTHEHDALHHVLLVDGVALVVAVRLGAEAHALGGRAVADEVLGVRVAPPVLALLPGRLVAAPAVAREADARRAGHPRRRDVAHAHRHALLLGDDDVADVAQRADEADAAHVERLLADGQALPADVLVGVGDPRDELRERDAVAAQAIGVDLDVEL